MLAHRHGFVGTKIDSRRERIYPFRCDGFVGTYRSGNRKKRIGTSVNAPLKKYSAYGADIITPHLPQAASSPQGEDNWVRCKIKHRTFVTRNVTVSTIVPNRATRGICIRSCPNAPLKKQKKTLPNRRTATSFLRFCCGVLRIEELRNTGNKQRKERWKEESNE